jgi:hypothetical protein
MSAVITDSENLKEIVKKLEKLIEKNFIRQISHIIDQSTICDPSIENRLFSIFSKANHNLDILKTVIDNHFPQYKNLLDKYLLLK